MKQVNPSPRRMLWVLAVLCALCALPAAATAQDEGKDDVESQLRGDTDGLRRIDQRTDEEKAAAESERAALTRDLNRDGQGGGVDADAAVSSDEPQIDPARIEELMQQIEASNAETIRKLEQLLTQNPTNRKAPEWRFRIAEAEWEIVKYRQLRDHRQWTTQVTQLLDQNPDLDDSELPPEPAPRYDKAIEQYRLIVAQHPDYERLDEVLFKLGDGLIRNDQPADGVSFLRTLVQKYPESPYLDQAWLALGEHYFSLRQGGAAELAYETVVKEHPSSPVFNYAQYKLAWTYYNRGEEEGFVQAVDTFKKVVEHFDTAYPQAIRPDGSLDEEKLPAGQISFRNQALNDLIVAYAEVPGGWHKARDYFQTKMDLDRLRSKMVMFAELIGEKGEHMQRVEIYRWLMEQDPLYADIPKYAERIIDSYFNNNEEDKIEAITREFIDYFQPDGRWAIANADNERAAREGRRFAEDKLFALATTNLQKGIEYKDAGSRERQADASRYFGLARQDHETFLARYPDSQYAYDANFYYAYILDEISERTLEAVKREHGNKPNYAEIAATQALPDLRAAAQQYQRVIEMRDSAESEEAGTERTIVSANRQVFVYGNILATADPNWSLAGSARPRNINEDREEVQDPIDLSEPEQDFVGSVEQYAGLFPTHEDTPGFLWRAAEIYRSKFHYDLAAQRFDDLITNFPDHEYAGRAVGSMFILYNKAENWPKIEYWAEWLLEKKNFQFYKENELEDMVAYSIDHQHTDLFKEARYQESAEKIYQIKTRFPERSALVATAIFKAARTYDIGGMVAPAIKHYEEFLAAYTNDERAPLATYDLAALRQRRTDFAQSADLFASVPDVLDRVRAAQSPDASAGSEADDDAAAEGEAEGEDNFLAEATELAPKALVTAVNIREGVRDYPGAIAAAQRYLQRYPDGDKVEGLVYHLAELHRKAGDNDAAVAQLRTYLERYSDGSAPERALAHLEIAKIIAEQGGRRVARDQDDEFDKIQSIVASMTDEEKATAGMPILAEVRFIQAERKLAEYNAVVLEFPVSTLRKRIQEKAALSREANAIYDEIIGMKQAFWSSAAAYRKGEIFLNFRDQVKALPIPAEIENDEYAMEEYVAWIEDELIYPLEDQAIQAFKFALQLAHELQVYNEWSRQSAAMMTRLTPNEFPVTSEAGVTAEHFSDIMTQGALVLDVPEPPRQNLPRTPGQPGDPTAPAADPAASASADGGAPSASAVAPE